MNSPSPTPLSQTVALFCRRHEIPCLSANRDDYSPNGVEPVTDPDVLRERIPRIINLNTGGPQPETIGEGALILHFTHANLAPHVARKVLSELVEDGVIAEENGRYRVASA